VWRPQGDLNPCRRRERTDTPPHNHQCYDQELRHNGYDVLRGNRLKKFKEHYLSQFGNEISFVTKTTVLGVFDFRAFLNIAMLLAESAGRGDRRGPTLNS